MLSLSITIAALLAGVSAVPARHSPANSAASIASTASTATATGKASLTPSCAPGGNFDLDSFDLQLPIGKPGHPETITAKRLEGCSGYQDSNDTHFYTEKSDGAMVMKVPGSPASTGCVTTAHSKHCRTELREVAAWDPKSATNRLTATLAVPKPDDSKYGTVVGQVHINDSLSALPVCELYYSQKGVLTMGVERTRTGHNENYTVVGHAAVGSTFTYEIAYENGELSVSINYGKAQTLDTFQLDSPASYFKAGNYNQGNSASEVHFFSVKVEH